MNYYKLREQVAQIIPRATALMERQKKVEAVKEKGRKTGYQEFNLVEKDFIKQERLLNLQEISSFVEISCRAAACPMCLNIDVWDGLLCPYNCKYCFANNFRASLYTAFFDNSKTMGLRHCNPDKYKKEMDKLLVLRGTDPHKHNGVAKAISMDMPLRFGIRFEDFLPEEWDKGISLELLNYLADNEYPLMINTKSEIVGKEPYLSALSRNKGKVAVHMTLITSNNKFLADIEPGAPSYKKRLKAMKNMVKAGIRVVARIEPFMVFINDKKEETFQYIQDLKDAGVRHITFDTYSYTANNQGIRQAFKNSGWDWDRMFLLGGDSQSLASILLGEFMKIFRNEGFSCSTFDMGNMPDNNQTICCEVGDWFNESGWNYGCSVYAARYIIDAGKPVSWKDFEDWVMSKGGFLTNALRQEVHELWNFEGTNDAYSNGWCRGLEPVGWDKYGIIWNYNKNTDFRKELFDNLLERE